MDYKLGKAKTNKVRLQDMTWVEVRDKLKEGAVAMIPFASQEQHGPQTPMGDFLVCERVAIAAAERTGSVVAPVIAAGYSPFFRHYPGTISLRHSTLAGLLEDYVDCLMGQGFERIVFFNGHNGNNGLVDHVVRKIRDERGLRIPVVNPTPLAFRETSRQVFPEGGQGHGGAAMTSLHLYLNPEAVRMDLATSGKFHDWSGLKVIDLTYAEFQGSPVGIYFDYDEITDPSGVVGDNSMATAEKGKILFDKIVEGCTAFVEWMKGISWKV